MAEIKITRQEIISLCRLCLGKDLVSIDIFEAGSELRHLYTKIVACLPVQVFATDTLPHKICEVCNAKVDDFYQFWTCTAKNQKQLNDWLQIATDQITDAPTIKVEAEDTSKNDEFDDYDDGARGDDSEDEDEEASVPKRIKTQHSDDEDTKPTELISSMVDESSEISDQKEGNRKRSKEIQLHKNLTSEEWYQLVLKKVKKCPICNVSFNTASLMRQHYRMRQIEQRKKLILMGVKQKKKYECAHCSNIYMSRVGLIHHMAIHTGEKVHVCTICKSQFHSNAALKRHQVNEEHTARVIKEASEEFVETGRITIEDWNEMVKQRIKKCPLCKKTYSTAKDMRRHLREVHSTARPYKCATCGKCFKSERHISQHKRRLHLGIKKVVHFNFECFHCAGKFNSRTNLADHMTSHTGIKNHVCNICQSTYTTARGLRRHNKNHLRDTGILSEDKMYKCNECDKIFIEQSEMVKHRDWVHGDKCSLCKVCGARVKGNLKDHMRTHTGERPICCHICGKKLRGKLREHLLTHSEERPFGCEICGSTFKYRYYLGVHMRKHTGERPYVCNYCGHSFAARSAFTLHLKRHTEHGYLENFQCQVCKNRFSSEETLNSHLSKHFGLPMSVQN